MHSCRLGKGTLLRRIKNKMAQETKFTLISAGFVSVVKYQSKDEKASRDWDLLSLLRDIQRESAQVVANVNVIISQYNLIVSLTFINLITFILRL